MTTTLETVSGIKTRIFTLPNRPPFMLAADMATAYQTTVKRINEAVKRNPARFPERYAFRLTLAEEQQRWSQFAATSPGKRTDLEPLVFTHGGANMLASVLRGPVADEMSVTINDAFTEMEQAAIRDANKMLARFKLHAGQKHMRAAILANAGHSVEEIRRTTGWPGHKVEAVLRECLRLGMLDEVPAGLQGNLFDA